jgi:hypothetical protein
MGPDVIVLRHLLPFIIPIIALLIPIVAIVMSMMRKMRQEQLMHETLRQMVEKGQPIPPELLSGRGLTSWTDEVKAKSPNQLRDGAMSVAAGLGLAAMFYVMRPDGWLWAIGLVPLFVGVAMLIVWRIESARVR